MHFVAGCACKCVLPHGTATTKGACNGPVVGTLPCDVTPCAPLPSSRLTGTRGPATRAPFALPLHAHRSTHPVIPTNDTPAPGPATRFPNNSYRPTYPQELYDAIYAAAFPNRQPPFNDLTVADIATGSGQALGPMPRDFGRCVAIDVSPSQLSSLPPQVGMIGMGIIGTQVHAKSLLLLPAGAAPPSCPRTGPAAADAALLTLSGYTATTLTRLMLVVPRQMPVLTVPVCCCLCSSCYCCSYPLSSSSAAGVVRGGAAGRRTCHGPSGGQRGPGHCGAGAALVRSSSGRAWG